MSVKSRVTALERAKPAQQREHGREFARCLLRAYGDGDEPAEPMTAAELAEFDETWEAALGLAYGADTPPLQQEVTR